MFDTFDYCEIFNGKISFIEPFVIRHYTIVLDTTNKSFRMTKPHQLQEATVVRPRSAGQCECRPVLRHSMNQLALVRLCALRMLQVSSLVVPS